MANKVDVFTEELSKVFTILQQQYVMIKYMKALITSGELDETEINKLKEQITLINTNIDNMMNDQIVPIKQNIERIEQAIDNITNTKLDKITTSGDNRVYGISSTGKQTNYAIGYYVNNLLSGYLARFNDSGRLSTPTPQSNNDCANKKYVDDAVASAGGGGKLYRHDLLINNVIHISFYSTNALNIDSIQDLTTIVKPKGNKQYICGTYDSEVGLLYAMLIYDNNVWKYIVQGSGATVNITTINDSITII